MALREQLRGTGVAMITAFRPDFSIDYDALEHVIDFVIKGGVEYIVALGTTGETPTLSKAEKIAIVQFTYDKVNGRVPVVVGIGGNKIQGNVEGVKHSPPDKAAA